jgi:hypothetical protein
MELSLHFHILIKGTEPFIRVSSLLIGMLRADNNGKNMEFAR